MVGDQCHAAKTGVHFAEPPWNEPSAPWRQIDAQLPHDPLARAIRQAMNRLDVTLLYQSSRGRGQTPHRPDLMLAIVLFETRRGQRKPSQWFQDTQENGARWWLGFGRRPARSCWYELRDRLGPFLATCNERVWHQAVEEEVSRGERGALDGSAVAANASRRRLINDERLHRRVAPLTAARHADAQGHAPDDVPGGMAKTSHPRTAQHTRSRQAHDHRARLPAANQRRLPSERRPPDKIVVSTGDPEAALGWDKDHVVRPLYPLQTIRDVASPLILSYAVFAQATDAATFPPMLARTEQLTGRRWQEVLVDSGDGTGVDLAVCAAEGGCL